METVLTILRTQWRRLNRFRNAVALQNELEEELSRYKTAIDHLRDFKRGLEGQLDDALQELAGARFSLDQEVASSRQADRHLAYLASHDSLTRLGNRNSFMKRLEATANLPQGGHRKMFAILFTDIDGFKLINDTHGHIEADKLLSRVGWVLQNTVQPEPAKGFVARFGGDEFVILLDNINSPEEAKEIARKILSELLQPPIGSSLNAPVSMSIGLAFGDSETKNKADILRNADAALYRAKANGRGRIEVFDEEMAQQLARSLRLQADLGDAIDWKQLRLVYQPIISLDDGSLKGFEALARWKHPNLGEIGPNEFIPLAENNGLIRGIGQWVLSSACAQMAEWLENYSVPDDFAVSVNLSGQELSDRTLLASVKLALNKNGLDGKRLVLEITENAVIDILDESASILDDLSSLGCPLHMDDFGTGAASLSSIVKLPVSAIKIDRTFVSGLRKGSRNAAMVEALAHMAEGLRLDVVAEGVEKRYEAAYVKRLGCRYAQGFAFAPPLDAAAATELLTKQGRFDIAKPKQLVAL